MPRAVSSLCRKSPWRVLSAGNLRKSGKFEPGPFSLCLQGNSSLAPFPPAPEVLVSGVVERLRALGAGSVETLDGAAENVYFPLPRELLGA